jgi:SAM-dependent methyltransferase/uncharacterized protein YbaR (Trm112 family)
MRIQSCEFLQCPLCRCGELTVESAGGEIVETGQLVCLGCQHHFPIRHGVPIFLRQELLVTPADSQFSNLDAHSRQKVYQREWHDVAHIEESDYKGASYHSRDLFAYLLLYQLHDLENVLRGHHYSTVANICSGHGFELEFLSMFSREIVAFDISLPSLLKTIAKGSESGVSVEGICCDVEELPVRDRQFDLVLAHHSLHHLANPLRGLQEMARISRKHCVFSEPAKGFARTVVTKLGLKPKIEESGNLVYEFGRREIQEFCRQHGLTFRHFQKCLVTGPAHEPGWFGFLDRSGLSSLLYQLTRIGNRILGSALGTKCNVLIESACNSPEFARAAVADNPVIRQQ